MRLDPLQRDLLTWGGIGVVVIGVGYVLLKWVLPNLAQTATSGVANTVQGALQGLSSNQLTQNQTDLSGGNVDYSGFGPASSLGAAVNGLTGGAAASTGEAVGSGLFSLFGSQPTGSSTYYTVTFPDGSRHAIGDATIDSNSNFSYGGVNYRLGDDGTGKKIATPLTTIYGSGAG